MGKDEEIEIGVECSVLEVSFSFDVGRSMFDVRRSSFKTTLYGTNVTCECLQNKLALMGLRPNWNVGIKDSRNGKGSWRKIQSCRQSL
jgi:hypothetical protein